MPYRHFTREERGELRGLLRSSLTQQQIATVLVRDPGALSREIAKGGGRSGYTVKSAARETLRRRTAANQQHRKLGKDDDLTEAVGLLLEMDWSPEQISGRMRLEAFPNAVGFSTIYEYVNPQPELARLLPRKHSKYRRKHGIVAREQRRKEVDTKRNIAERPPEVAAKSRIGDWEGDTVIGSEKRERIVTHLERRSGYLLAAKTKDGTAPEIRTTAERGFRAVPAKYRKTLTLDNGREHAEWDLTEKHTGMKVYFANPYHSWERGANENANGLLRRYFPKGTPFATLSPKRLAEAASRINHRPRKRLGYKTPYEVFHGVAVGRLI